MTRWMGKGLAARGLISGGRRSYRSPAIFGVQPTVGLAWRRAARWPRTKVGTAMDYSAPTICPKQRAGNGASRAEGRMDL